MGAVRTKTRTVERKTTHIRCSGDQHLSRAEDWNRNKRKVEQVRRHGASWTDQQITKPNNVADTHRKFICFGTSADVEAWGDSLQGLAEGPDISGVYSRVDRDDLSNRNKKKSSLKCG